MQKLIHFLICAIFLIAGMIIGLLYINGKIGVFAQQSSNVPCVSISYSDKAEIDASGKKLTRPVLVSGVANSGTLDFTKADADLAACAYKGDSGITSIKGLAWNTNLGWMSFEGIKNSVNYSTIVLSANRLRGDAYGTNIGFIHLGCENGSNFSSSLDCTTSTGVKDYGVRVAVADGEISGKDNGDCGTMKKGDIYGFAWTDTVGWMDFCGAHVDLDVLEEEPPAETPPTDTDTTTPPADTSTNPPYMETYPPKLPAYQVARVTGNVKGNMIVDTKNLPFKSWISYPIGDPISSSRERFLRIAKKSSVGLKPDSFDFDAANTKTINAAYLNNISADKNGIYYFKRDKKSTSKEPCKIIFDDTGEIQYGKALEMNKYNQFVTIVSEGCDVYIDRNLRSAYRNQDTDQPLSRLGIIAFSDLSMAGDRKGGNVYICSRVTDIESHLAVDGSLFSYGREENYCGKPNDETNKVDSSGISLIDKDTGYPNFENVDIGTLLKNQLAIVGMFLGSNTYGGSVADKPTLGDGTIVGTSSENIANARLFDVNFLRYANVEPRPDAETEGELCWSKDAQLSKYSLDKGEKHDILIAPYGNKKWKEICEYNFPIDSREDGDPKALTTIIYMDPTADLPIFNGMAGKK